MRVIEGELRPARTDDHHTVRQTVRQMNVSEHLCWLPTRDRLPCVLHGSNCLIKIDGIKYEDSYIFQNDVVILT